VVVSDQDQSQTIGRVIGRSFILACSVILVLVISAALYFNLSNLKASRQNSLQKVHQMLNHILAPALSISNTMEVNRVLQLASTKEEIFAVIDIGGNVFIPDYAKAKLIKSLFDSHNFVNSCRNINAVYYYINGSKYWFTCSLLRKGNFISDSEINGALISLSKNKWFYFSSLMSYFILLGIFILILLYIWFHRVLHKRLLKPLILLGLHIKENSDSRNSEFSNLGEIGDAPLEVALIKTSFESMIVKLHSEYKLRSEIEKKSALLELAARVAHDIRSPLAVMEVVLAMPKVKAEEDSLILCQAIQSVRDLTNNLLSRYRDSDVKQYPMMNGNFLHDDGNVSRPILLYALLNTLISHKHQEWNNFNVELNLHAPLKEKFSRIGAAPGEVNSMLSNLLNNAYESFSGSERRIQLKLELNEGYLQLFIQDNGRGIPSDKLVGVLNGDSSKHAGRGMGLSNAKFYMESLGGKLILRSRQGEGTCVVLAFPCLTALSLFPEQVILPENSVVVIVDDDYGIHDLWKRRLKDFPVELVHFYNSDDALLWSRNCSSEHYIYFVDYDLGENQSSGLVFLESIRSEGERYLVTSYTEEVHIQKRASNLDVRLIPKFLLGDIQLHYHLKEYRI